ncbi:MAG TPA: hypothetical protein VJW20_18115, partial [Candidatus Angelobacter sp.]|nr:hypothetical protein [Candidatus Angelobacter sp.]
MKTQWLLIALLSAIPLHALQGSTPQAALEELATTTKPEVIARHLPEPVQKKIEDLPRAQKQRVMEQLLEIKATQLGGCTVRPAHDSDGWEILDDDGNSKGTVKLANAFISGTEALLPLEIDLEDGAQNFIVTMHLEDDEWRIDDFGPWEKNDLGLEKLVHQPTQMEKNEAAAQQTLREISLALRQYGFQVMRMGLPPELSALTEPVEGHGDPPEPYLDKSFAADPLIKDGYTFRYVRTQIGGGQQGIGLFEITATPVEFGKTGSKNFFADMYGIHATSENRPATVED